MGKSQDFTTIDEQIKRLKNRGLKFQNIDNAKSILMYHGYFNIINGYKDLYIENDKDENGDDIYKSNTFFEEIFSLYNMDSALSLEVLGVILDIESHLKSVLAYVLAEHYTSKINKYLDIMNFKNSYKSNSSASLSNVLNEIKNNADNSNKDPIKYHRINYNNVPPWVVFKETYFSTVINLTKYLKKDVKDELICLFYNINIKQFYSLSQKEQKAIKDFFSESLKIFKIFRNACAHGNRTYNLSPKDKPVYNDFIVLNKLLNIKSYIDNPKTGLEYLLLSFSAFNRPYYPYIKNTIIRLVENHRGAYPNYIEDIKSIIGLKIFN